MFSAKTTRDLPNNETHYTVELLLCRSGSICSKFLSGIHVSTIATNQALKKKDGVLSNKDRKLLYSTHQQLAPNIT